MQIKELEAPSILPTLEALDAEFGCEDEQCAAGCHCASMPSPLLPCLPVLTR